MTSNPSPRKARGTLPLGSRLARCLRWLDPVSLVAVALASLVLFDNPSFLGFAVNSDSLQLASMTWDLAQHDYAWRGFQLSRVPSLFPDLIVYGTVQMATASWRIAALVYGGLSLLGIAAAAGFATAASRWAGWARAAWSCAATGISTSGRS